MKTLFLNFYQELGSFCNDYLLSVSCDIFSSTNCDRWLIQYTKVTGDYVGSGLTSKVSRSMGLNNTLFLKLFQYSDSSTIFI